MRIILFPDIKEWDIIPRFAKYKIPDLETPEKFIAKGFMIKFLFIRLCFERSL